MIKWDPNGAILASCADDDDTALLWSPNSNESIRALRGHTSSINAIRWTNFLSSNAYAPLLATASKDTSIKIWDIETGNSIMTLQGHE